MLGARGCDIYGQDIGTVLMSILITRKQPLWEIINLCDGVVWAYFIVLSKYGLTFFISYYLVEVYLIVFIRLKKYDNLNIINTKLKEKSVAQPK